MLVIRATDIPKNMSKVFDSVVDGPVLVPRQGKKENVFLISQSDYEVLQKIKNNYEMDLKLDRANRERLSGRVVRKSMKDLEAMANG